MGDKHGDKDACDLIILSDTANIYGWIAMKSCLMRDVVTEGVSQQLPPVQVLRTAKENSYSYYKILSESNPNFDSRLR